MNYFFPFTAVIETGQSITWTVPAAASPGSALALHLEARDFAGNVSSDDWTFDVSLHL